MIITKFLSSSKNDRLSLRQNFSWNFIGNLIYAGCQWGIIVLLAKLTNPEAVGQFALGLAVTAPIIIFSQFHLRGIQATDANDEYDFGHYLTLRITTTVMALIVIINVIMWGGYSFYTALVLFAVGLAKSFESISDVFYGLMQRHERMDYIARSRILKGVLSLLVMGSIIFVSKSVLAGVIGLATTWGVTLLTYDLYNVKLVLGGCPNNTIGKKHYKLKPIFYEKKIFHLVWLALPLAIVMALISLKTNIPRFFIEKYLGASELGVFAALAYLIVAGNTIVSSMGQSCVHRLAKLYSAGETTQYFRLLSRLVSTGIVIGGCGVIMTIYAGRNILLFLYNSEYAEHVGVLVALVISGALSYVVSLLGYGLTATRRFKTFLLPYIILTFFTFVTSLFLIPKYGLKGAALSDIAVNLANLVFFFIMFIKTPWRNNEHAITKCPV